MSTAAQQYAQQFGQNIPSAAPVPPTQSGQPSAAQNTGAVSDELLNAVPFDIPSESDAFFFPDVVEEAANKNAERLNTAIKAEDSDGTFVRDNREVRDILGKEGLARFGFTETKDEVIKLYEGIHGEGRVRVFEDTEGGITDPQFYVSLQRKDGSFTPYSSPTQDLSDYAQSMAGTIGYDIAGSSATVGAAWTTSAAATGATALIPGIGPFLAPVVGGLTFGYMLYAGGGTVEKYKQDVLKDDLGLTEQEADEVGNFLERILQTAGEGYFTGEFTEQERMAGLFEMGGGILGSAFDKVRLVLGRRGRRFIEEQAIDESIYPSAVTSQRFADATKAAPGTEAAMIDGVDVTLANSQGEKITLGSLTVADITDRPIIRRLSGLASQTSVIIPRQIREAANSAATYLRTYGENLGGGDFAQFRRDLASLQDAHSTNRDKTPIYKALGESIQEVDVLFRKLRFAEAQGLYANVFDAIGQRSYDLSSIDQVIRSSTRAVIPEKVEGSNIAGAQLPFQRGESQVYDAIEALKTIGTNKDGTLLSGKGLEQAVKVFNEANPGYEIVLKSGDVVIDSPAKLLQMFATRFGEMSRDLAAIPTNQQTSASRNARTTAKEMRNTLLELIGNPNGMDDAAKTAISQNLKDANAFYKETFDITERARTQAKSFMAPYDTEPGAFSRDILLKNKSDSIESLLAAIDEQEAYVIQRLKTNFASGAIRDANPAAMQGLQGQFDELVKINIARTLPVKPGEPSSPTAVRDFFDNFSDDELESLGYSQAKKMEAIAEAEQLADLASGDYVKVVGKDAALSSPFLERFKEVFNSSDINTNLRKLVTVSTAETAGAGGVENLRKGFFDYLVSTQSKVLKPVTSNTPYQRVGDYYVDTVELGKILDTAMESAPELRRILTEDDFKVLQLIQTYTATINRAGPDAGSALAGAQIIGELFTVDPQKFIGGLTRLASQQRISQIFTSEKFVRMAVGLGSAKDAGGFADTAKTYFFGKGAVGAAIANIATGESPEAAQTRQMLEESNASMSPNAAAYMKQFKTN